MGLVPFESAREPRLDQTLRSEKGGAKAKKSFAEQQIGKEGEGKSLAEGDF